MTSPYPNFGVVRLQCQEGAHRLRFLLNRAGLGLEEAMPTLKHAGDKAIVQPNDRDLELAISAVLAVDSMAGRTTTSSPHMAAARATQDRSGRPPSPSTVTYPGDIRPLDL